MPADVEFLLANWNRMVAARRQNWETEWIVIGDMCAPRKLGALTGAAPGQKMTSGRFTALGEESAILLSNYIHGNLTNPALRWQSLRMRKEELNRLNHVQNWLDHGSVEFSQSLNASNFETQIVEHFYDAAVFGTSVTLKLPRAITPPGEFGGWLFHTLQIGTYVISEDKEGRVDTVYRSFRKTVRAAYQQWGEAIGKEWIEVMRGEGGKERKPEEMMEIIHAIYPRTDLKAVGSRKKTMPWASVYFDPKHKRILEEGGYVRFPGLVTRWTKNGDEVWGRGPAHTASPELNTLNRVRELELAGWALDIAPATFEQEGAVVGGLDWTPAARNIVRGDKGSVWTLPSGTRYDISTIKKEELKRDIERAFFVDQIRALPPADKPSYMTAFEVAKRYEETFRLLGTAFGHMKFGMLQPLVESGIADLYEQRILDPIPPEMEGEDIDIEYEGPLARAQKASDLQSLDLETAWVLQVQPLMPEIMDNIDWDKVAQHRARVRGIPASLMNGEDEVAAIREERAEQERQTAELQKGMALAEAAGKAAPMVRELKPEQGAA